MKHVYSLCTQSLAVVKSFGSKRPVKVLNQVLSRIKLSIHLDDKQHSFYSARKKNIEIPQGLKKNNI